LASCLQTTNIVIQHLWTELHPYRVNKFPFQVFKRETLLGLQCMVVSWCNLITILCSNHTQTWLQSCITLTTWWKRLSWFMMILLNADAGHKSVCFFPLEPIHHQSLFHTLRRQGHFTVIHHQSQFCQGRALQDPCLFSGTLAQWLVLTHLVKGIKWDIANSYIARPLMSRLHKVTWTRLSIIHRISGDNSVTQMTKRTPFGFFSSSPPKWGKWELCDGSKILGSVNLSKMSASQQGFFFPHRFPFFSCLFR